MRDFAIKAGLRVASAQQHAFWLANEIDPGTSAFNLLRVFRLTGVVHKEILERSFEGIVARHEALRTGLVERNGAVMQQVHAPLHILIEEHDFTALSDPERAVQADSLAMKMGHTAFDLARPPHFRVALVRLAEDEHLLAIVFHHVVIDGWSMGPFFEELASLYHAGRSGEAALLPELRVQYADFAEWQERCHAGPTFERSVDFWRRTLELSPPLLTLPTVRPRAAVQNHSGARLGFSLDAHLVEAFRALCSRRGATLFMGLLSAFQILLQRWADTDDIVVGTPVAGRHSEDLAPLIGCFVNTLALRGDLSGNPSFVALLARMRTTTLEAWEHQEVPFERVVAEMKCPRTRGHTPLYQAMFVLHNFQHPVPRLGGLQVEELDLDPGLAKLDLTLEVTEGHGLACSFEYDCELFDQPMMARMTRHFKRIVEAIVAHPERPIGSIRLLDKDEWRQATFDWNATAREFPECSPAEVFAAVAGERPEDVALISGERRIRFGELGRLARQIAAALRSHPASGTMPVAVFLPRSIESFAAVLGCLSAGVPWVPLDTAQPEKRLAQLASLAGCRVALTFRALAGRLPEGLTAVPLDSDAPLWSEPDGTFKAEPANNLAYVLFTSGSTGVPKGVMGATRALMNRIAWMHEAYPFSSGEVACCKTSIGFVDSVWEMLGPLLAGVPTVIVPEEVVLDPEALISLLAQHRVTRIVLVPTLLRLLLDQAPDLGARLPALNMCSVSGEVLAPDLAQRFRLACPGRQLVNLYGSSEVAADVLVHDVGDADVTGSVPIGKPIANTQVYVLDRTGQPAPVGLPGVIHVGGFCLALGYWRRPDLTAERFIRNPIEDTPSPLLFNTGDRGIRRADGIILYLGRTDGQVKLRGIRLELGEIATTLRGHAAVRDAAAVIAGEGDLQQLVAFVVGHDEQRAPVSSELRAFLRERLPLVAVPARLLVVDALPLLPSGKVDQVALVALAETPERQTAIGTDSALPGVAQIWRAVLREEQIVAGDDFFDLGGNSLLATQVIARVRRRFGIDISIRALFDNSTLAAFSRAVEEAPPAESHGIGEIRPQTRPEAVSGDLQARLAQLSPAELDALIRSVRQGLG